MRAYTNVNGTLSFPGVAAPEGRADEARDRESPEATGRSLPLPLPKGRPGGPAVRALNLAIAVVALILLSPLLLAIAVAIKLGSPGPMLYSQARVGMDRRASGGDGSRPDRRVQDLGGRPFRM